jgi:nucleotide-binding universal stress UspA family protein
VDVAIALADDLLGPGAHAEQEQTVRDGLARALGRPVAWPVHVALGDPAAAIAGEAERCGAALVVVGLRCHGRLARLAQDETALRVMRAAACPVLAVTASLRGAPRRAAAAVDFTDASLAAARAALALVAAGGTLTLTYVEPAPLYRPDDGEHRVHELGVAAAFGWLEAELAAPARVRVERAVVRNPECRPPGLMLAEHAERTGADLLAVGTRRHGRVERFVLGSVTTDVARDGRVSVLAVPPGARPGARPGAAAGA